MNYHNFEIALQEVPGEISLCFSISGCPLRCEGCHSPFLWNAKSGTPLTVEGCNKILNKYKGFATCVLFMGGEWHEKELIQLLKIAKKNNYKTCLYTGEEHISKVLIKELTWLKTGSWNPKLGGLNSATTNQKFIEIKTQKLLNHLFIKN
ncbi:anaerobic ribonucleoside-triphosphate reductase activating protein [Aestuariivivens insulae]|uniref:anaerobic ribonucleoside-triphosphate reductase activating protein n=1 Tax=Aestuariivivens insulae TaxID=1621988 RepID=UPI001F59DF05|nr:anaerobic ribonucleoside-triphosphate reductase activating protein [Aestuariivivens insulae]